MAKPPKAKKTTAIVQESAAPLQVSSAAGEVMLDLSPETVAIYRRWYTYLSREEALPKRLGLISAVRGEGVTSVALRLAAVLAADLEARVALVECNWWWPGLAAAAHLEPAPALAELVQGQTDSATAARASSLPNLTLFPAGDLPECDRSRTARSAALGEALNALNDQFDHLILDLPAVLAVKDSPVLAGRAEALCLVIRQGLTPMPVVRKALDEIEHLPVRGVILNAARLQMPKLLANLF